MAEDMARKKKKLLEVIKEKGYVTPEEAKKILKIRAPSIFQIHRRIPEIKEIWLVGGGSSHAKVSAYEIFDGSALKRVWYTEESHPGFITFTADLLPSNLPADIRRAITHRLRNQGLSLETIHKIYIQKMGRSYRKQSYLFRRKRKSKNSAH